MGLTAKQTRLEREGVRGTWGRKGEVIFRVLGFPPGTQKDTPQDFHCILYWLSVPSSYAFGVYHGLEL